MYAIARAALSRLIFSASAHELWGGRSTSVRIIGSPGFPSAGPISDVGANAVSMARYPPTAAGPRIEDITATRA